MSVLSFDNVSKQYSDGHLALDDVSFSVAEGEMLFVTGHSGAGKSTLLRLIQLDERPTYGEVLFDDLNLLNVRGRQIPFHRRQVGAVYQDHRLLMDYSVGDNVALPLVLRGIPRAEIGKQVCSVLSVLVWPIAHERCHRSCRLVSSSVLVSLVRLLVNHVYWLLMNLRVILIRR